MNKEKDDIITAIEDILQLAKESSVSTEETSSAAESALLIIKDFNNYSKDLKALSEELQAEILKFNIYINEFPEKQCFSGNSFIYYLQLLPS
ncbi:hypothetical protein GOM49_06590 [Clostridium bovifaecis]|uniref:Uncharacterized protein n=1 Tax=Clostridium bovifaecis TaxID=2184719 RepID=A0A6I6EMC2_9CLOT|nr:hypothetical protein GOM49_06590 [Clostridium bovifaecis]